MTIEHGVFGLTGTSISVIAVVAFIAPIITYLMYRIEKLVAGAIFHCISLMLTLIVMTTWWTSVDWMADGDRSAFGTTLGSIVVFVVVLIIPAIMLAGIIESRKRR